MAKSLLLFLLAFSFMVPVHADSPSNTDQSVKKIGSVLFLLNPAKAEVKTDYTPETMVNLIEEYRRRALAGEFKDLGINSGFIEMDVKGEKAKLTFFTSSFGSLKKALKMKVSPEGDFKRLVVKARVPFCQMRELWDNNKEFALSRKRWRFSNEVESRLKNLLEL